MQYPDLKSKEVFSALSGILKKHCIYLSCLIIFIICPALGLSQNIQSSAYTELPDPTGDNIDHWQKLYHGSSFSFASPAIRYDKHSLPSDGSLKLKWHSAGWKGEKIHTQLLIYSDRLMNNVEMVLSDLKSTNGYKIKASNLTTNFVRYVMTNGLNTDGTGCEITTKLDSSLKEDVLDNIEQLSIPKYTVQPVWLTINIPRNSRPGIYLGSVCLKANRRLTKYKLNYTVTVLKHTLLPAASWKFHLDLWQNPYAIARISNTGIWSDTHFKAMAPYMKLLAGAGQKTITTTIIYDPWNSQTFDKYGSMIKWIKRKNGSWAYEYSTFDKWVAFMMSMGIDKQINCYSMIPWGLKFSYYDDSTRKDTLLIAKPGSEAYADYWKPMLTDFAKHLKAKGWFDKTCIAMDERPLEDMQKAIAVIRSVDKDFKIALAGRYHPEIEKDIFDYCVASNQQIDSTVMNERNNNHYSSTFYTSCTENIPNTFTFSPPAEAAWFAWFALNKKYGGYLRWAYNCWNKNPLVDSRFGKWSSGDAFLVYPGCRSSIRFEMLIQGIQDYEKVSALQNEFIKNKQHQKSKKLENTIQSFNFHHLKASSSGMMLNNAEAILNSF